jgi:hypothetical protein
MAGGVGVVGVLDDDAELEPPHPTRGAPAQVRSEMYTNARCKLDICIQTILPKFDLKLPRRGSVRLASHLKLNQIPVNLAPTF